MQHAAIAARGGAIVKKMRLGRKSEWFPMVVMLLAMFAARSSLADHYFVPSGSMEYTLMPGDRVIVNKMSYGLRLPFTSIEINRGNAVARGDIVIFDSPDDGKRLIKRIVAVGGDNVAVVDGHVFINGDSISGDTGRIEKFADKVAALNLAQGGGPDVVPQQIGPGLLLAMGDHRGSSHDSRYFGLVSEKDVYGKAVGVYRRRGEGFVWRPL